MIQCSHISCIFFRNKTITMYKMHSTIPFLRSFKVKRLNASYNTRSVSVCMSPCWSKSVNWRKLTTTVVCVFRSIFLVVCAYIYSVKLNTIKSPSTARDKLILERTFLRLKASQRWTRYGKADLAILGIRTQSTRGQIKTFTAYRGNPRKKRMKTGDHSVLRSQRSRNSIKNHKLQNKWIKPAFGKTNGHSKT